MTTLKFQKIKSIEVPLTVGVPFVIYLLHVLLFGNWIVDDAGISFSYSRNFAQGFGLVSQPGLEPVEGYSSFTWVFLFVPFFWLNYFHPVFIPKAISILLVFLSFITLHKTLRLISSYPLHISFICLVLLSLNTSFVVWTSSGLENPLYVFLTLLLLYQMIKAGLSLNLKTTLTLAILTALLAATRPDGILFFFVPIIFLLSNHIFEEEKFGKTLQYLGLYVLVFFILFGSFLLFRITYFNDLFPNTYYAKGGPSINDLKDLLFLKPKIYGKVYALFNSGISVWGILLLGFLAVISFYLITIKKFTKKHFSVLLILFFSVMIYVLLPPDWMGEFRFATIFYPLFYICLFTVSETLIQKIHWKNSRKIILAFFLTIVLFGPGVLDFTKRTIEFRENPTVPFQMVARQYAYRFDNYASILNLKNASILLPDAGGTLFYSKLRVFDLAGLTDKKIAGTFVKKQKDFYDYVFEVAKPVFIHTHGVWAYRANFYSDRRFNEDYLPLKESIDPRMVKKYNGQKIYSGEYIRKDAVNGKADLIQKLLSMVKDPKELVKK